MDEEIALRKSEKKKHKKNKENEALNSSEVPTEKIKHKKSKEKEALSSSEVPAEKKKHKKSKDKEAISSPEVLTEKKKHKKSSEKEALSSSEVPEEIFEGSGEKEGVSDINGREKSAKRKIKKVKGKVKECSDVGGEENDEHVKKRKGKKNKRNIENGDDFGVSCIEKSDGEAQSGSRSSKKRHREEEVQDVETGEGKKKSKKKKKRTRLDANIENAEAGIEDVEREDNLGSTNENLGNSSKRVKFASHVEVFPSSDDKDGREENPGIQMIKGKRFTKEEDQIIKDAVYNYIEAHQLGEAGLEMVLDCRRHRNLRHCWREIGLALPYRTYEAVYQRGHTLFTRDESRTWTEDEKAFILQYVKIHGNDWKGLADILGKNRYHVHDTYRRIFRAGLKKGRWSQAEYQSLFNSVNQDLRMHMYEEKYSKHGMIKDNISWNAIGNRLATRTDMVCCQKWYNQLASPLVKKKLWADVDDYKLLDECLVGLAFSSLYFSEVILTGCMGSNNVAKNLCSATDTERSSNKTNRITGNYNCRLVRLDACCIEDVDWDNLLEHRPGDICLKRWRQMVNHIGQHGLQSFAEQVEVLAKRYCPELLEVREALDSRTSVD